MYSVDGMSDEDSQSNKEGKLAAGSVSDAEFLEKELSSVLSKTDIDLIVTGNITSTGITSGRPQDPSKILDTQTCYRLLQTYHSSWHSIFPILHWSSFMSEYRTVRKKMAESSQAFVTILNLVFCIAALADDSIPDSKKIALEESAFMHLKCIETIPSISSLQAIALAEVLLGKLEKTRELWRYRALAAGMVTELGLERSIQNLTLKPLERELRRRVFWCVYVLDIFQCTVLDRVGLYSLDITCEIPSQM